MSGVAIMYPFDSHCLRTEVWRVSVLTVALLATSPSCTSVKETGRHRVILMSSEQETKLGQEAFQEQLAESRPSDNAELVAAVRRVGERVARASGFTQYNWEYALLDSNVVNATCAPGGKIVVYSGILPIMANEAGMAAVLGHEVAHATARHSAERATKAAVSSGVGAAVSVGMEAAAPGTGGAASSAMSAASQLGFMLPYSRLHESEADEIGLMYMARAGYDPREAIAFWQRMESTSQGKDKPPQFLSTHPSHARRIESIQEQIPKALEIYNQAPNKYGRGETLAVRK